MTALEQILQRLGLYQYHEALVAEGFDTWETVLDIQESDLESLQVKLGHRRRLQRAIAESRGIGHNLPLQSPSLETTPEDASRSKTNLQQTAQSKDALSAATEQKRKYRRHPKPDERAPEKPPSAYVLFSNRVREEVKGDNLSFTEIARLVGERWQKLDPVQKEKFESHASSLKETYNADLTEYKKTDEYMQYMEYLADFKAKHSGATPSEAKRPKLESEPSSSLSAASQGDSSEHISQHFGHSRGGSIGSASTFSYDVSSVPLLNSAAQLATSLPASNFTARRSGSPLAPPPRLHEQSSTQSSHSEEGNSMRLDPSDSRSRTAQLSLFTPPSSIVGAARTAVRPAQHEYPGAGLRAPLWSGKANSHGDPHSAANSNSPANQKLHTFPNNNGFAASDTWRERGAEAGRQHASWSPHLVSPTSSVPLSHLVSSALAADTAPPTMQRTLPPLRQSSSTPTNPARSFGKLGIPAVSSPQQNLHFPESMPVRDGHQRQPSHLSDTEAADTLMGLAERPHSQNALGSMASRSSRQG